MSEKIAPTTRRRRTLLLSELNEDGSFGERHVRRKRDIDGTSVRHHPSGIRLALRLSDHAAASRLVSLFDQAITGRSTMIHDTKAVSTDYDPGTSIVSGPREKKSPTPKRALNAKNRPDRKMEEIGAVADPAQAAERSVRKDVEKLPF
ncbi:MULTISPECIES: hypothetical protein [Rhizobium]|uniref:Uncharacterized protein n=1 Tax=Rhizobium esperanzae TaxID=1967781 RepID=A0A7W6UNL8_9HYPH|nr:MULTISPECIES: hypothetical protein [Rhizobium]MBB4440342.1 hypothetical protein [Rhizobium esperanzae]MDH6202986.1 hypothetical protein [Rhizobium leguminosarum]